MSNFNRTCRHCVEIERLRRFTEKVQAGELTRLRKIEDAARAFIDTGSTLHHNELVRLLEAP